MMHKLALIVLVLACAAVGWGAWDLYHPFRGYAGREILDIAPGTTPSAIADVLVAHGVLAHRWAFLARYWVGRTRHRTLKAGEYLFDHPLRPIDVYRKLIAADVYLHPVLVPEGSDQFDIARILADRMAIDPAQFLRLTQETSLIRDLDPAAPSLDGYLFPDTYRFPRGVTAAAVVAAMLSRFRQVLRTKFHGEFVPGAKDLHAVVTLASLVEKETPDAAERPVVAGVFTRRLQKRMLLECDPTVVYAARLAERPIGVIHQSDLKFDSLFNTYLHGGLPPGPIANPGESSLRAALHPADGSSLYFVSNNHGGHIFSLSLTEHLHNVARYRRTQKSEGKNQGAGSREAGPASRKQHAKRRSVDAKPKTSPPDS